MDKITIIQLLNKIANEEEVSLEIKCYNKKYRYDSLSNDYEQIGGFSSLFKDLLIINGFDNLPKCLNDEVEILEKEKKIPEKLFFTHISNYNDQSVVNNNFNNYFKKMGETINEIIDYIKSKGE